jgi:hypothetical protein
VHPASLLSRIPGTEARAITLLLSLSPSTVGQHCRPWRFSRYKAKQDPGYHHRHQHDDSTALRTPMAEGMRPVNMANLANMAAGEKLYIQLRSNGANHAPAGAARRAQPRKP